MFNQMQIKQWAKVACCTILIGFLTLGLASCGDGETTQETDEPQEVSKPEPTFTEVAPPAIFQQLRKTLDNYQPQVSILSPDNGDVIEDTTVSIEVDVNDYPLFKREELGMGPHLHVILDNQPYRAVYNADEPIVFEDLSPGTHTIRMFASRPWHESFKNEGAYDQVTFHLFTETGDNAPDPDKPLLTYSRPKGSYGAEPILLDYYLTNAPIQRFEQDSEAVNPATQREWRVRATINGESFIMDSWMPVHLKGFNQGQNWIKLELLDGDGNLIENEFNTAARMFSYQPKGQDTLSKLVRGELSLEKARLIVDQDYELPSEKPEEETEATEEEAVTEQETAKEDEEVTEEEQAVEEQEEAVTEQEAVTEEKVTSETPEEAPEQQEKSAEQEAVTEEEDITPESAEEPVEKEQKETEEQGAAEEKEQVKPEQQQKAAKEETVTEEEEVSPEQEQATPVEEETEKTTSETTPEVEKATPDTATNKQETSSEETATQQEEDITSAETEVNAQEAVTEPESDINTTAESETSDEASMEKANTVKESDTESDEQASVDEKEMIESSNSSSSSDQEGSNTPKTSQNAS